MGDTGNEFSSATTQEEDDSTLEKQQKKIERLSALLLKAKDSITSYKAKIEDLEKELFQSQIKQSEQQTLVTKLSKFEPPKSENITEVLCRIKVLEETYCYVKSSQGCFWLLEGTFKTKFVLPDLVEWTSTKKSITEQINNITQEWQEKHSKVAEKLGAQETKNGYLQEIIREQVSKNEGLERDLKKSKENLNNLVALSANIYDGLFNMVLEDVIDNSKINSIQKLLSAFSSENIENDVGKVKDHCILLLKCLFDTSKRLLYARNELKTQDSAWRSTCDALLVEKEELKQQISRIKAENLLRTENYEKQITQIKKDTEKQLEDHQIQIKHLEDQLSKGINTAYLKHVLIQYIFADSATVQESLLNVLSTILSFSEEEILKIKEHRAPKGVLNKYLKWQ